MRILVNNSYLCAVIYRNDVGRLGNGYLSGILSQIVKSQWMMLLLGVCDWWSACNAENKRHVKHNS